MYVFVILLSFLKCPFISLLFSKPSVERSLIRMVLWFSPWFILVKREVFLAAVTCIKVMESGMLSSDTDSFEKQHLPLQYHHLTVFWNSWNHDMWPLKINAHSFQVKWLSWLVSGRHINHFIHTWKPTGHQTAHTHNNLSTEMKF